MIAFLVRRLLWMVPTTIGIALVVFTLYHAVPGDPALLQVSGNDSGGEADVAARVEAFRREHGLDRSLVVQFLDYLGPVNLGRDGHPAFDHPRTERAVDEVTLADGRTVREGRPLAIEPLPGTDQGLASELDAARRTLLDDGAGEAAWEAAVQTALGARERGWPALLTALYELRHDLVPRSAALARVSQALERATGHTPVVDAERERALGGAALVREWFRWYYDDAGGDRVPNSGAHPWGGLLCLELGQEMETRKSVAVELRRRLAVTVPLAATSLALTVLLALPLGIFSARRQGKRVDAAVSTGLFLLYSIPTFWAGLMLVLAFGRTGLDLLPVLGLHDKDASALPPAAYAWDTVRHCVLPVVTLTYGGLAYLSRQMRTGVLEVVRQDYVRTARAKGLPERVVVYKHVLRNSLIPVVTVLAAMLPTLVGGAVIVETVFDLPGTGKYAYEGLLARDFSVVMATTMCSAVLTQVALLVADVAYSLIEPRIRHGRA